MLDYADIEAKFIDLLNNMPTTHNCEVRVTPDDWDADTYVYSRNSVFVQFASDSPVNIDNADRMLTNAPIQQRCTASFTFHIASQRLRASSQSGAYELAKHIVDTLSGKRFADEFGPVSISDVKPIKRGKDKYWRFTATATFAYWRRYYSELAE